MIAPQLCVDNEVNEKNWKNVPRSVSVGMILGNYYYHFMRDTIISWSNQKGQMDIATLVRSL